MEHQELNKESIMDKYLDYVLTHGKRPINVYVFAKDNGYSESEFYQFFSGFETLEKEYMIYFFKKSLELSHQIEGFEYFTAKEKLLNFYFILFENFSMNRSLVITLLKTDPKSKFRNLNALKNQHIEFVRNIHFEEWKILEKASPRLKNLREKSREEILWKHFLSILDFWVQDQSAAFEKTDLYIEKSIDTGFEIIENPLIDKVFDLSKFLWKEKFQTS